MNGFSRFTLALIFITAFAWSVVPTSPASRPVQENQEFAPAAGLTAPEDENSAVALADMRAYVQRHFVVIKERPETYKSVGAWGAYELRSLTFDVAGGSVRVHHATSKADGAVRYTFFQDGHPTHGQRWEPVH